MSALAPAAPPGGESGLVILVPAAEPAIARRIAVDPQAALDVPAHVTVLFPFVPPDELTADHLREVDAVTSTVEPFDFRLTEVRWFGEQVVWLSPVPDQPFARLTERLAAAFPDFPPYGGAHDEVVVHLTVLADAEPAAMRDLAEHVAPHLPITGRATEVVLLGRTGTDPFTVRHRWLLGRVA